MFNDDGEMQIAATNSDLKRQLQVGVSARLVEKVDATVIDGCALLWTVHWPEKGTVNWAFTRYDRRTERSVRLVCPNGRMKRLHVPIVGPTGRPDPGYVRPVGQTSRTDRSDRL